MANANKYLDYAGLSTLASSIKTYITNQNFISQAEKGLSITSKKVGHSNTAITAQGTQALYPIKIDTYGHITGYGSAVTSLPANGGNADTVDLLHLNDQAMAFTQELTCEIGIGPGCLAGTMTEAEIFALTGNRYGQYYLASDTNKVYRRHVVVTTASSSNWRNDTTQYNASLSLTNQLQDETYIYIKVKTGYTYYSRLPKFFVQAVYDNTSGSTTITGYCRQQNKFMINSCNYNGSNILGIYQPTANTDVYYLKLKRYTSTYGAKNDYSIDVKVMTNFNADSNYGLEFIGKNHTEYATVSGYNYIAVPVDGFTCNDVKVINGVSVGSSPKFTDTTYSAGTGLSLSGTKFNHSNSITAQTAQAVYPIKIDAQGHITAYGSAVTIPTIGVLNTTNTTTQSTATNESFGGTINLHKISKTGSYNDLLNKPNIVDTVNISNGKIQICVGSTVISEVSLPIWDGTVI